MTDKEHDDEENEGTRQLKAADLTTMTPEQILSAEEEGRMDALLGRPLDLNAVVARTRQPVYLLDRNDVATLRAGGRHDLIAEAHAAGNIRKDI